MTLPPGTRIGVYEIASLLGEGGMGQVYRAVDTRLKRHVAIKVLPAALAADAERLTRFQREAEVLASLNHPHIAGIYGLEEAGGVTAIVMELVEGENLAQRLARGPLTVADALHLGRQITEALEAAHQRHIVHRDLKPANISVRDDGTVKVLDFGLAKALEAAPQAGGTTVAAATTSPAMTQPGMILGTAAYMSPEQARGAAVDKRADVWAFGCVFYEMVTGARAFSGTSVSEVLASVLAREPDWTRLPAQLSPAAMVCLQRCLEKDPAQRIRDIADARMALEGAFAPPVAPPGPRPSVPRARLWAVGVGSLFVGAVVAAGVMRWNQPAPVATRVSRLELAPAGEAALSLVDAQRHIAISPDGLHVVYVGSGSRSLYARAIDSLEPVELYRRFPRGPFFSPDGQWLGFTDGGQIKKVAIGGGPVTSIAAIDAPTGRGAAWGQDGTIVFGTTNGRTGLLRVSENGGVPEVLTRPDPSRGEADHFWPEWLPDGRAVLFTIAARSGGLDASKVAVLDLASGTTTVLFAGSHAFYVPLTPSAPTGHLLFATRGTMWAVPFDPAQRKVQGNPQVVLRDVVTMASGEIDAALANDGTLAYVAGPPLPEPARRVVWVDREGAETAIPLPPRAYTHPRISPDGKKLALYTSDQELDLWLSDFAKPALARLTSGPGVDSYHVWTPDGRFLIYSSQFESVGNLYRQRADGVGPPERLSDSPNVQTPSAMSPDGKVLLFSEIDANGGEDIMQMVMDGSRAVSPLIKTAFMERNAVVSPDGRWVAYEANESDRFEIYVSPFPDVHGARALVSTEGGVRPLWAPSGKELFFVAPSGAVMGATVTPGATWAASTPAVRVSEGYFTSPGNPGRTYDVSPDGERMLMIKDVPQGVPNHLVIAQHWLQELRRVGVSK